MHFIKCNYKQKVQNSSPLHTCYSNTNTRYETTEHLIQPFLSIKYSLPCKKNVIYKMGHSQSLKNERTTTEPTTQENVKKLSRADANSHISLTP
jgi:hypothetical protein